MNTTQVNLDFDDDFFNTVEQELNNVQVTSTLAKYTPIFSQDIATCKSAVSSKLNLGHNLSVASYPKHEKKIKSSFSFANKELFDLTSCYQLKYWNGRILHELHSACGHYDIFIKIKDGQHKRSADAVKDGDDLTFNQVCYLVNADHVNNKLWVTVEVSYSSAEHKKILDRRDDQLRN
jgi:hypothetical protein